MLTERLAEQQVCEVIKSDPKYTNRVLESFKAQYCKELWTLEKEIQQHGWLYGYGEIPKHCLETVIIFWLLKINEAEAFLFYGEFITELKKEQPNLANYLENNYLQNLSAEELFELVA